MRNSIKVFAAFILLEFLIIIISILLYGITLEALQATTRFSGRLSLLLFSLIFLLKHKEDRGERWISDKPYLLFAVIHGIHLVELLAYGFLSNRELIPIRLLGGFIAYVMIFLMPWVSLKFEKGNLSVKAFSRIEIIYLAYVWFIFFMAYLPRILGKLPDAGGTFTEFIVLFSWVVILPVLKIISIFKFSPARNA